MTATTDKVRVFGRYKYVTDVPDLTEIERKAYEEFLMVEVPQSSRPSKGLEELLPEPDVGGIALPTFGGGGALLAEGSAGEHAQRIAARHLGPGMRVQRQARDADGRGEHPAKDRQ